jgi:stage II sporulation protein D
MSSADAGPVREAGPARRALRRTVGNAFGLTGATAAVLAVVLTGSLSAPAGSTGSLGPTGLTASASGGFAARKLSTLALVGHGYGHGRGMSQWGAYGAAVKGLSYASIMSFYYPGTTMTVQGDPTMRVLISADTDNTVEVRPAPGLSICHGAGLHTTAMTSSTITSWRLVNASAGLVVQYRTSTGWHTSSTVIGGTTAAFTRSPTCSNYGPLAMSLVLPSGATEGVRGGARAYWDGSHLRSIGVMPMTSYLAGVVASEMPSGWPTQALRAQSVAARTYAERYRQVQGPGHAWDICDTTSCQVFHGTNGEAATTTAAVIATAGHVLTYHGTLALTEFSASNGGYTVAAGSSAPYMVAKADPYDGVVAAYGSWKNPHTWTASVSGTTVQSHYPAVGTLTAVRVLSRDGHGAFGGRIGSVQLVGTAGSVTISGSTFRSVFALKSDWWIRRAGVSHDLTGDNVPDLWLGETSTSAVRIYAGDGAGRWTSYARRGVGWDAMRSIVLPGDLDGDGRSDVVGINTSTGDLYRYPGDALGWLGGKVRIGTGFSHITALAGVGDLTGDGLPDLMGIDSSTGTLRLYRGNGAGGIRTGSTAVGSGWSAIDLIIGVGDVNGDGNPDLVGRVAATGELRLYRGNGAGAFLGYISLGGDWRGFGSLIAGPGDWNGDGHPDLLAINHTTGQLLMFAGNGSGFGPGQVIGGQGWGVFNQVF